MPDIEIRELVIPESEGATGWDDLVRFVDLSNSFINEELGAPDLDETPSQILSQLNDPYSISRVYCAYRGDHLVGVGQIGVQREQTIGWLWGGVVAAERRKGLGSRLLEMQCRAAAEAGAKIVQASSFHADLEGEPRLQSPAGPGSVPMQAPATGFLQSRGFKLGQVEIMSSLPLPVSEQLLDDLTGSSRPADDYEVLDWTGPTPEDLIEGYARLRTAVSTAVPSGELSEEEQVWDAERVRNRDRRNAEAKRISLMTVARHRPSGELVAFTGLSRPAAADGRAVDQGYTMVLPEHRGHNLGLRIKINNLRLLMAADHGAARVITGNAGENEAMLRINRALGFRPFVMAGAWEKKLSD